MENKDTGFLLNERNIKLHRTYFSQMVKLLGINAFYRVPLDSSKTYNGYGELDTYYTNPIMVGCIYDEHPSQKTMRMLGWNAELADATTVLHVPYDLQGLQAGCLFIIPSGLDKATGRVFKVLRMSNIAIYPASVSCEVGPLWVNEDERAAVNDFRRSNFNLLASDEDEENYGH